jgi:mono/diheme cytochrome c family protein
MSTTISMWLGIAFVMIGIVATIIQAWLWSFPMAPDPGGPDPNGLSTAPKFWTNTHRFLGLAYVLIYVVLMIEMVPRLWEYQVEFPSRTVMHICMGIIIGVLLIAKIAVIRWFQHFGKSLPTMGLMILMCTLILGTLSIPYAIKAHDFGDIMSAKNIERVGRSLKNIPDASFPGTIDKTALLTEESMDHGRSVLVDKCVVCHDLRSILKKPKSGKQWLNTVLRMQKLPSMGSVRILDKDIGPVTSWLIAINPSLQEKKKADKANKKEERKAVEQAQNAAKSTGSDGLPTEGEAKDTYDDAAAEDLVRTKCTECHEMDDIETYGGTDREGWGKVIVDMVEEGGEFTADEIKTMLEWLVRHHGKTE